MFAKRDIYLIGFSCSGKSTIGPILAKKMKKRFYDIDCLMEQQTKMSISDIFDKRGENYFRDLEYRTIKNIALNDRAGKVISLGGGAFENSQTRNIISKRGITVYLSCSQRELYRRIVRQTHRPLLKIPERCQSAPSKYLKDKINRLLSKRTENYKKADIIVSTTKNTVNQTIKQIIDKITRLDAAD